ncbi:MAG TPA: Crp/Fnr family transcriptional regulator [Oscillospiraceae bacterium]|nr:Crp/Fnr family transcriptional regulator [Oscillospiraceae bacterium]HXK77916.1 Crp/Fnr family transcriptional regulator [Oscillospiraceae bacterium]
MLKRDREILRTSELFVGAPQEAIDRWLDGDGSWTVSASSGETIFGCSEFCRCLGVLLRGRATVYKVCPGGRKVILSVLEQGKTFGMSTLFYEAAACPTEIVASGTCKMIFFSKELVERAFAESPEFARSYVTLLSRKIHFLNRRLATFVEADCRDKLLSYLSGIYTGGESVRLPGSMSELAQTLGVGRASLYRAFDSLEEEDILRRDGRTILVRNAERLSIE